MGRRSLPTVAVALALLLFAALVVKDAWVSEDAYITFRTIDNWRAGYGLRWNVAERVQTYTHPLWMLVVAGATVLTGEYLLTTIVLSILVSLAAVGLLLGRVAVGAASAALGILILALSKAFVDYSTSGLENPLTHLLLVAMAAVWMAGGTPTVRRVAVLALIAGLLALTRPDAILLCLPALAAALVRARRAAAVAAAAAGLAPLIAWELFSVLYYGFPFPNTAYAKLATGIATSDLAAQGVRYLGDSLAMDPITLVATVVGVTAALLPGQRSSLPLALGVLLHLAYVVKMGGDFMSGRFLTAPLVCAVAILVRIGIPSTRVAVLALAAAGAVGVSGPRSPLLGGRGYGLVPEHTKFHNGIADERAHFFQYTGLFNVLGGSGPERHDWAILGRELRDFGPRVMPFGNVGFAGFFAGPGVHLVDRYGIGDPLLARLPVTDASTWRPGHFDRELPNGYLDTLRSGANRIADPGLAAYHDRLRAVTRDRLLDRARLAQIWRLNLGPPPRAVTDQRRYSRLLTRGAALVEEERWAAAVPPLEEATSLDRTRAGGWCRLASAYEGSGRLEEARRTALECIDRDRLRLASRLQHVGLADAYGRRGDRDHTVALLREALAVEPHLLEVHMAVANSLLRHGQVEESLAVNRASAAASLPTAHFHDLRGGTFADDYRSRLEAAVQVNMAAALRRLGRVDEAIEALREAVRIRPDLDAAQRELEALSAAP